MTPFNEKDLGYLVIAQQCLVVLLIKTDPEESARANLLDSIVICVVEILALGNRALADGNTRVKLVAALVRMGNLDETGENISLPCFVQWVIEVLDVPLEQPQLSLETDGVSLQPYKLALYAVVSGFQGELGGAEFLNRLGVSFEIHDGEHKRGVVDGGSTRMSSSSSDQDASDDNIDASWGRGVGPVPREWVRSVLLDEIRGSWLMVAG